MLSAFVFRKLFSNMVCFNTYLVFLLIYILCRAHISAKYVCSYVQPSRTLDFYTIDLTHTVGPKPVIAPVFPKYNFTTVGYGYNKRYKTWFEHYYIGMPEHTMTHVDAPAHIYRNRPHMHEIPIENLIGPGVIIDVRHKVASNSMYGISKRDLLEWEYYNGIIPDGAVVIANTGWHRRYPNKRAVFNGKDLNDIETFRFPHYLPEAVNWLLENRRVIAVGIDTISPDILSGKTLPVHLSLFKDCVIALEGVANLDRVPASGSTIFIAPLKLYHGSGSPARIFATVPKRIEY